MKIFKSSISLFLAILMIFTTIPFSVFAEDNSKFKTDEDLSIEGSNSFGQVISNAIEESQKVQEGNDNCHISDISIVQGNANVEFVCSEDCNIAVTITDENTNEILASGIQNVKANDEKATVELESEENSFPEYYVINAAVVEDDFTPISPEYKDTDNTEWYEEFQELTVNDFDSDLVINLDEKSDVNFAVFNEEVNFVSEDVVLVESNKSDTLNFGNIDRSIQTLSKGDYFCYNKENPDDMILGKVADIDISNNKASIRVEEVGMSDVFDIVKIDYKEEECNLEEQEKNPQLKLSTVEQNLVKANPISGDFDVDATKSYKVDLASIKNVKGSLSFSTGINIKLEWNAFKLYASATVKITPKISVSASISLKTNIPPKKICSFNIPVGPTGLVVKITLKFIVEASISASISGSFSQTKGFSWSTSAGKKNLSTNASATGDFKIKGKIKVGVLIIPEISALSVVDVGLEGELSLELSASQKWEVSTSGKRHDCDLCIAGELSFVTSLSAEISIDVKIWEKEWKIPLTKELSIKIADFHWSITYGEFSFEPCQHYSYKTTIRFVDESGNPLRGVKIDGMKSDSNGTVVKYYPIGQHALTASLNGYKNCKFKFGITDKIENYKVVMKRGSSSETDEQEDSSFSGYTKYKSSLSYKYSAKSYVAPLTYTEPTEGVYLSTALANQRRSDVAWVQRELKNLGYDITADGYYGNLTANVVMQFQRDYNLPVTGAVNANVVAVIKKPIKPVTSPTLRLTTATNIPSGGIATVAWDGVTNAEDYNIYVYNSNNELVNSAVNTKSTTASFVLYDAGEYTIKAISENERFTSTTSELNTKVIVHNPCLVSFVDYDGTLLSKQFVEYGKSATAPAAPERDGYTFSKWDGVFTNLTNEELTVTASYVPNQYTVKFLNTDGTELISSKYYFGENAAAPDESSLNIQNGYAFVGWDKDYSNITSDITVKPVVEWINDDLPIIIDNYSISKDDGYGYNISTTVRNFDKKRTNGRVVVALKTETGRFITMTESSAFTLAKSASEQLDIFVPCNENVYYIDIFVVEAYEDLIPISETVRYTFGESNSNPGDLREPIEGSVDASFAGKQAILFIYKVDDAADYTNEFIGQSVIASDGSYHFDYRLREEPTTKTGDYTIVLGIEGANGVIYLGKIEAPKPSYTVRIVDYDDSVIDTQTVIEGESATLPINIPERPGYTFAGWDYSNTSIHENLVIHAIYVPKTYSVVFIDWTNERFDVQTYYYGEPLRTPELSSLVDYNTIGWDCEYEGMPVTENMVITAKYEKKTFDVKFYDYDGNLISQQTVEYGEEAELPDLREDELHNFYGWDEESLSYVQSSLSVHPYFTYKSTSDAPIANKETGIYSDDITVSLSSSTENSEIYYSVNGSDYALYSAPLTITSTSEIRAYTSSFGKNDSDESYFYFIINEAGDNDNWKYPVTVYDNGAKIKTLLLNTGEEISSSTLSAEKNGYSIEGLYFDAGFADRIPDNYILNSAIDVYVNYLPEQYIVTFIYEDENGAQTSSQTVNYLDAAEAPEPLGQIGDTVFIGWDTSDYLCVTENLTVYPVYVDIASMDSIKLNRSSYTMVEDFTYALTATTTGENIYEIFWESSDESIATVDENGKVTALNEGLVVITATILGKGISDSCFINVERNPELSIVLSPDAECAIVDNYICGISPDANSVNDIINQIQSDNLKFYNGNTELRLNDVVCTGTIVNQYDSNGNIIDTLTIVVVGDVDGDGIVTNRDASHISRHLVGKEELTDEYLLASDVNADGYVNNRDASMVSRYLVGKESI